MANHDISFEALWAKKDERPSYEPVQKPAWWNQFQHRGQSGYWQAVLDAYNGKLTFSLLAKKMKAAGYPTSAGTISNWVRGKLPDRPFRATIPAMEFCKRLLEDADRVRRERSSELRKPPCKPVRDIPHRAR